MKKEKLVSVNFRVTASGFAQLKKNAEKFTNGSVSRFIRFAAIESAEWRGVRFSTPLKSLGKLRSAPPVNRSGKK